MLAAAGNWPGNVAVLYFPRVFGKHDYSPGRNYRQSLLCQADKCQPTIGAYSTFR